MLPRMVLWLAMFTRGHANCVDKASCASEGPTMVQKKGTAPATMVVRNDEDDPEFEAERLARVRDFLNPSRLDRYEHVSPGCVVGENTEVREDKSLEKCAEICDADASCLSFEYGVDHGGSSTLRKAHSCHPQTGAFSEDCDGSYYNTDLWVKKTLTITDRYEHISPGCVVGENIRLHEDKSLEECAEICADDPYCVSFEYGVDHDGSSTLRKARSCHPQHGDSPEGCDGSYYNTDLYVKRGDRRRTAKEWDERQESVRRRSRYDPLNAHMGAASDTAIDTLRTVEGVAKDAKDLADDAIDSTIDVIADSFLPGMPR